MFRTLEAIFRHPIQLFLMLIFPIVVSFGIAVFLIPRSYQSSATLWALRRYEIIGATGPETDLLSTPAQTQVTALTELLQSRAFDLAVAKSTNLQSTLKLSNAELSDPQLLDAALISEVSQHVIVTVRGYNSYEVSYTNPNAHVAYQTIASVIQEFKLQGEGFSVVEGQRLLQGYQTQLVQAKSNADADAKAESQYLAGHPGATPTTDPQYGLLDAKRLQSQSTLQSLQSTIATLNQEIATQSAGDDTFFKTLDPPIQPDAAVSRSKTLLTAGGMGAGIGLAACIFYIVVLVRRDRAIYSTLALQKVTAYPILMQLPQLSLATQHAVVQGNRQ
jgi:hypothetical protein